MYLYFLQKHDTIVLVFIISGRLWGSACVSSLRAGGLEDVRNYLLGSQLSWGK